MRDTEYRSIKLLSCAEWSNTYQCVTCGVSFVVSDDSNQVWEKNYGHRCLKIKEE